jgi:hypothetical protein
MHTCNAPKLRAKVTMVHIGGDEMVAKLLVSASTTASCAACRPPVLINPDQRAPRNCRSQPLQRRKLSGSPLARLPPGTLSS